MDKLDVKIAEDRLNAAKEKLDFLQRILVRTEQLASIGAESLEHLEVDREAVVQQQFIVQELQDELEKVKGR